MTTPADPYLIFPSKPPSETLQVTFPFLDVLQWAETLSSTSFTATVWSGSDNNPSALILSTSPASNKSDILLQVQGGTSGVIYNLSCKVVGSSGNTYQKAGLLAVVEDYL